MLRLNHCRLACCTYRSMPFYSAFQPRRAKSCFANVISLAGTSRTIFVCFPFIVVVKTTLFAQKKKKLFLFYENIVIFAPCLR